MTRRERVLLRLRVGAEQAHYGGGLVDGAFVLKLFGDAATELLIRRDGDEGLFRAYSSVDFLAPVHGGDYLEVEAEITRVGKTSREMRFEARKVIAPGGGGSSARAPGPARSSSRAPPAPASCPLRDRPEGTRRMSDALVITVAGVGAEVTRAQQPHLPLLPDEVGEEYAPRLRRRRDDRPHPRPPARRHADPGPRDVPRLLRGDPRALPDHPAVLDRRRRRHGRRGAHRGARAQARHGDADARAPATSATTSSRTPCRRSGRSSSGSGSTGSRPSSRSSTTACSATADVLFAKGLLTPPAHFDFVLGVPGAAAATAENLTALRPLDSGRLHLDGRRNRPAPDGDGHAGDRDGRPRARRVRGQHLLPQGRARRLERPLRRARRPHRPRGRARAGLDRTRRAQILRMPAAPPRERRAALRDGPRRRSSPAASNLWDTTLIVLGLVLGGGIFLTPVVDREGAFRHEGWILAVWIVGGLLVDRRRPRLRRDGRHDAAGRRDVRLLPRGVRRAAGLPLRVGGVLGHPDRLRRRRRGRLRRVLLGLLPVALERARRLQRRAVRDLRGPARGGRRSSSCSRRRTTSACTKGARIQGVFTLADRPRAALARGRRAFASARRPRRPPAALTPAAPITSAGVRHRPGRGLLVLTTAGTRSSPSRARSRSPSATCPSR